MGRRRASLLLLAATGCARATRTEEVWGPSEPIPAHLVFAQSGETAERWESASPTFAQEAELGYLGTTMAQQRAGKTVKVSVSLDRDDLAVLKKHAKSSHHGNLSAAFAEAAKWLRQREARQRLVKTLGGPTLTRESAAAIDAEQEGGPRHAPKKSRAKKAA
jgi:hypothetical protein